ncbi:MAG TPA: glutamate ABC transporter substrate-binding protein [Flexivirga sp.]|uniref:glutamate ABC transporter substrate-binding protein n=1 Tax=Flexivirga sp. TaxID=1962927 RepID=UPI002B577E91|nr:glutamate ABC transporter substrate-binding protein [Flexivirga sp.]HWC24035.1 glutamate ABC transporter substrate-binding protein [Flexivirga sp.]
MKYRAICAATAAAALGLGLTACGGSSGGSSASDAVCKLPDSGPSVKIGIKFDQPGLGLKDGDKYTGFDVDIARCVAAEMGYSKITFVESPSPQREKMLAAGTVKMIAATYSITPERLKEVGFAGPYFVAGQSLLVGKDSKITNVKGLSGKKVCSVTGSTSVDNLKKEQPKLVPQKYDTYSACAEALASGSIDAMTTDDAILAGYSNQAAYKDKFKLVGGTFSEENYGIGLKKGSPDCNKVAAAIKKTLDNGNWKKALENNLGSDYKYNKNLNPPKSPSCKA